MSTTRIVQRQRAALFVPAAMAAGAVPANAVQGDWAKGATVHTSYWVNHDEIAQARFHLEDSGTGACLITAAVLEWEKRSWDGTYLGAVTLTDAATNALLGISWDGSQFKDAGGLLKGAIGTLLPIDADANSVVNPWPTVPPGRFRLKLTANGGSGTFKPMCWVDLLGHGVFGSSRNIIPQTT